MRGKTIGRRSWSALIAIGLVGQVALTAESAYLNLFVYDTVTDNPHVIAAMVAAGAIAATVGTMVVGAISDRAGRRRAFIAGGYLLWGASMMGFGLISVEALRPAASVLNAVTLTIIVIILLDCVVSIFSGGAYSATFQAWVTDVTDVSNRGRAEAVLVTLPLLSLVVAIASLEGLARRDQWGLLFALVGAVTMVGGVLAWFLVKDVPGIRPQRDTVFASVIHGLRPRTIRGNPRLYLALAALGVLSIANQIYMPYLLIYIERYLGVESYALLLGVTLLAASAISIIGGRIIDRVGKLTFILPAAALYAVGLLLMFFVREVGQVMAAGVVLIAGFMLLAAVTAGLVRDYTPRDRAGAVQGVRILAISLVPSLIGPFIGAAVIIDANEFYLELGVLRQVPTPHIFLAAAISLSVIVIPVIALRWQERLADAGPRLRS